MVINGIFAKLMGVSPEVSLSKLEPEIPNRKTCTGKANDRWEATEGISRRRFIIVMIRIFAKMKMTASSDGD